MAATTVTLNPSITASGISNPGASGGFGSAGTLFAGAWCDNPPTLGQTVTGGSLRQGVANLENVLGLAQIPMSGVSVQDFALSASGVGPSQSLVLGGFNNTTPTATTTISAGDNGLSLATIVSNNSLLCANPQTAGFATGGTAFVVCTNGLLAALAYTGTSATAFTGLQLLSGNGTWTVATGASVTGYQVSVVASATSTAITVNATSGFTATGQLIAFHNITGTVGAGSNAVNVNTFTGTQTLSTGTSPITAGFATSGIVRVADTGGTVLIQYTGLSASGFTGCTFLGGNAGTLATGGAISQQTTWVFQYTGLSSTQFTGVTIPATTYGQSAPSSAANLAVNDIIMQFYNPVGTYITSVTAVALVGHEPVGFGTSGTFVPGSLIAASFALAVGSTLNLFPTQSNVVTGTNIAALSNTAWPSGATQVATTYTLPNPIAATPANIASLQASATWNTLILGPNLRVEQVVLVLGISTTPPNVIVSMTGLNGATGNVNTAQPTVTWNYSDPDASPQYSYRVVVFPDTETQAGWTPPFNINMPAPSGALQGFGATYWTTGDGMVTNCPLNFPYGNPKNFGLQAQFPMLPVYDSGDIISNATSYQITQMTTGVTTSTGFNQLGTPGTVYDGRLLPGIKYRVFVFVTSQELPGVYQTLTNVGTGVQNAGLDFTPAPEPLLMPSLSFSSAQGATSAAFSGASGFIGQIAVRARLNLMTQTDADFIGSNGAPSVGGWAYDASNSSGTGTTPSIAAVSNAGTAVFGTNAAKVTPWGTTANNQSFLSSDNPCTPGTLILAQARVQPFVAGGVTPVQPYLVFKNGAGTIIKSLYSQYFSTNIYNNGGVYPGSQTTMVYIQTKVPPGAATVALGVNFVGGTAGANPMWLLSQCNITANCINLMADASFGSGLNAAVEIAAPSPVTVGWWAQAYNGTSNYNPSIVSATGPSNPSGITAIDVYNNSGGACAVLQTECVLEMAAEAKPWNVAFDAALVPANIPSGGTVPPPGTLNLKFGQFTPYSTTPTTAIATATITPTFARYARGFTTASVMGAMGFQLSMGSNTNVEAYITNAQLEKVWTFTDGTFEAFTSGTAFPLCVCLGTYANSVSAQWWNLTNTLPTGGSAAVSNVSPFSGTNCALLAHSGTGPGSTIGIEQYFSVGGFATYNASAEVSTTTAGAAIGYIEFLDSAGVPIALTQGAGTPAPTKLTFCNISGTLGYALYQTGSLNVPANAAMAHIVFTLACNSQSAGSMRIDAVSPGLVLAPLAVGVNQLTEVDSSFETGIGTWANNANCSLAQTGAQSLDGTHSLAMTSLAAGTMIAEPTGPYAVTPGQAYTFMASFRAAVSARTVQIGWIWLNAALGVISFSSVGAGVDTTTGWTQASTVQIAPAGAAFVYLNSYVVSTGAANEVHDVDCAGIFASPVTTVANANLVPDSGFQYPLNIINQNDTSQLGWNLGASGGGFVLSNGQVVFTAPTTGAQAAYIASPASCLIPVTPSTQVTISALMDATGLTAGFATAFVFNSTIGTSYGSTSQAAGTKGVSSVTFTVPVGVTQVRVVFGFTGASMNAGATCIFSQPQLTATATAVPYTQGPTWQRGQYLPAAPSTPYLDGGWNQGGLAGNSPTVQLQRSADGLTWATCRGGSPNAGSSAAPQSVLPATFFEEDYLDYEYPGGVYAVSQTIYYRSQMIEGAFVSAFNGISIVNAASFSPGNWLLVDPLFGGNVILQVKGKVDFQRDENQTVLMPLGRGAYDSTRGQNVGKKVVLGDSYTFGPTITVPLQTLTYADYVALDALLSKTYPLVLRSPEGEMWNVRKTKYQSTRTWQGSYTRPYRTYNVVFETVDPNP